MRLTIVTGSFCADHTAPFGQQRHGHDWHVEVAVPAGAHKDDPQSRLDDLLSQLDHRFLDDLLGDPSNEGVAEWIGESLRANRVLVHRFDKGRKFGAEWRKGLP